jgi:hypothetical protein
MNKLEIKYEPFKEIIAYECNKCKWIHKYKKDARQCCKGE